MSVVFTKNVEGLANQAIVFRPLPTTWLIVANAVRHPNQSKDLFAEPGGGERFHLIVDLEAQHFQVFDERFARLGKLGVSLQLDMVAVDYLRRDMKCE